VAKLEDFAFQWVSERFPESLDLLPESFEQLFPQHLKGDSRLAVALHACEVSAEFMENEPVLDQVGKALAYYLENGILLADVHQNNIGVVRRDGYTYNVITDPGHAVDLRGMKDC
jgi:hypothetical protein